MRVEVTEFHIILIGLLSMVNASQGMPIVNKLFTAMDTTDIHSYL